LEVQLCNTEASERSLQEKVNHLTENFTDLEAHITLIKERLVESDQHALGLEKTVALKEAELRENELIINEQKDREAQLRQELDINCTKMSKREKEVEELMAENERLYRELNKTRHQLHEISINHGIDL
jgi:chromosome segregation ATPase